MQKEDVAANHTLDTQTVLEASVWYTNSIETEKNIVLYSGGSVFPGCYTCKYFIKTRNTYIKIYGRKQKCIVYS